VATILDLAERADVPVEAVLRVINGDPVSDVLARRVQAAIAELGGGPPEGVVETLRVLMASRTEEQSTPPASAPFTPAPRPESAPGPAAAVGARLRDDLLESLERAAATLETSVPGFQRVVYEALRVEVHPVAEHVGAVGNLVGELQGSLGRLQAEVTREHHDRLRDMEVLIDLVITGWRTVDQRLARIENVLERTQDHLPGSSNPPGLGRLPS
jgi:hypothetical protein